MRLFHNLLKALVLSVRLAVVHLQFSLLGAVDIAQASYFKVFVAL